MEIAAEEVEELAVAAEAAAEETFGGEGSSGGHARARGSSSGCTPGRACRGNRQTEEAVKKSVAW